MQWKELNYIHCHALTYCWYSEEWSRRNRTTDIVMFRRIVGMVKSGVEGTDIVLLKLDSPIIFSGLNAFFMNRQLLLQIFFVN